MYKHFLFQHHGTICQIHALTTFAWEWLEQNVYFERWQCLTENSICIEPRLFGEIFVKIKKEFV